MAARRSCRATACAAWRPSCCISAERKRPADPRSRVDTDAGWKTLSLIARQGSRYTFRAAMGQPERVTEGTLEVAGET